MTPPIQIYQRLREVLVSGTILFSTQLLAGGWDNPISEVENRFLESQSSLPVYIHPLANTYDASAFRLIVNGNITLDSAVKGFLRQSLNSLIQIKNVKNVGNGFGLSKEDTLSSDYEFYVGNVPICNFQVRAHKLKGITQPVMMGSMPNVNVFEAPNTDDWIPAGDALDMMRNQIADSGVDSSSMNVLEESRCLYVQNHELVPVWSIIASAQDTPYLGLVGQDGVHSLNKRAFDASSSATVQAYVKNPVDGVLATFTITNMGSDGYLDDDRFTTSPNGVSRAYSATDNFVYTPDQTEFDEASVFAHANKHGDFFAGLGFDWTKSTQVNLIPHALIDGTPNNALYTPGAGTTLPNIQVGDGDGVRLVNLPKDEDVVNHELGHHIIFTTLKSVEGDSLVIHEGLADYFAEADSGSPCLGPSICPLGSPIGCEVDGKCLRTAVNSYVLGVNTKTEAHLKSQFISGMLWDLRNNPIPQDNLTAIVYRGVMLFQSQSGYHDMVLAFLLADQELNNGKYCSDLYKNAQKRGLTSYITDFNCSNLPSAGFDQQNSGTSATATTDATSGSKKSFPFCGIDLTSQVASNIQLETLALLFLLPVFIAMTAGRKESLARTKKRKQDASGQDEPSDT